MLSSGFINVLKPTGMTSNDVVAKLRGMIRRSYGVKIKVGHTGTLDPNAAGVLLVALGGATKFCQYVLEKNKTYRAEILLGMQTDTLDTYGTLTSTQMPAPHPKSEIEQVLQRFVGDQMQVPPQYSALKVDGQRLYDRARRGEAMAEIPARPITITDLRLLSASPNRWMIDVSCSAGTYIRSLARDIGSALGEQAILSLLIRTRVDQYEIADSYSIEELGAYIEQQRLSEVTIPTEQVLAVYPRLTLQSGEKLYCNGAEISARRYIGRKPKSGTYLIFAQGRFLGVGALREAGADARLKSETLMVEQFG